MLDKRSGLRRRRGNQASEGATETIHNESAPPTAPQISHGRRMPHAEVVRSLSQPMSGLAASANSAPTPRMSDRPYSDPPGSSWRVRRASVTMIGVSSASQVPAYAAA